jgi:nicotinate-nucleotide adenylyltransferase
MVPEKFAPKNVSASSQQLRTGLFGGTFNPVHQAHLDLAGQVIARCQLAQLLFIPALLPPHKRQPIASFDHRAAMLEAALSDRASRFNCRPEQAARLACSRIEATLPRPSYTINTVESLIATRGELRYALIIGADALLDLPHWHRIDELLCLVDLIVVNRDGIGRQQVSTMLCHLGFVREDAGSKRADTQHSVGHGYKKNGRTAEYLDDIDLPVSSSIIRQALAAGTIPATLPSAVFDYIKQHGLYGQVPCEITDTHQNESPSL